MFSRTTRVDRILERFEGRLDALITPFAESPKITVHRPEGGFYLLPSVAPEYRRDLSSRGGFEAAVSEWGSSVSAGDCLFHHLKSEAEVQGVPGRLFGDSARTGVRLAFGQEPVEEIEAAADRISLALKQF